MIQSVESGEEKVVPITSGPLQLGWAVMSPDGRSVLVAAQRAKGGDAIYRVDVDSGVWTSLQKPQGPEVTGFPAGISPDCRTIYRTVGRRANKRSFTILIARDIETGQDRELLTVEAPGVTQVSPDGKLLAICHPDGKDTVIDVLPAVGGPRREVCRVPGFRGGDVAWTPDERYLIFGLGKDLGAAREYMRVPVEGGEAQSIGIAASHDGRVQFPRGFGAIRIHPNGRQLVYTALGGEGGAGEENWALENFLPGLKASAK